ncbi:DNA methyltransferase, partial [Pseudomonas aeruginosa]
VKGKTTTADQLAFEEKQYGDIWSNDEYLQFMYERLTVLRELLSPQGSIFLHCDPRRSHYLKICLDEIFGRESFVNEIIWKRSGVHA